MDRRNIPSDPRNFKIEEAYQKIGSSKSTFTPTLSPQRSVEAFRSFTIYRNSRRSTVAIAAPITMTSTKNNNTLGLSTRKRRSLMSPT
mmetsp:Transcript_5942/g.16903  ORF Transcript_5942/g.16903 Transcript_5942/m.16903 type:complete len:88 (-) Transcript_5942:617-880(-)